MTEEGTIEKTRMKTRGKMKSKNNKTSGKRMNHDIRKQKQN